MTEALSLLERPNVWCVEMYFTSYHECNVNSFITDTVKVPRRDKT